MQWQHPSLLRRRRTNRRNLARIGPGASNPDFWIDPDSYENPLVAACCGPYDPTSYPPEFKYVYATNCLFDAVQQICHGLPLFLRKQAAETDGAIKKAALNSLANTVEANKADCFTHLYGAGAPGPNGSLGNQLDGTNWSPQNNVTFTIEETWSEGWTEEGDVTWSTCTGIFDNDDAVIPTAPPQSPGAIAISDGVLNPGTTGMGSGPAWSSGVILPSSGAMRVEHMDDSSTNINSLRLHAANSSVTVNNQDYLLERSSISLREPTPSEHAGQDYIVDTGRATFVSTIIANSDSWMIEMVNDDPIIFRLVGDDTWDFDPFDLVYEEPGVGTWRLSLDGMTFSSTD